MKKFVCVIMLITLVASLFVGCTKTSELDRASNHAPASQDKTGITDTNNESNKKTLQTQPTKNLWIQPSKSPQILQTSSL